MSTKHKSYLGIDPGLEGGIAICEFVHLPFDDEFDPKRYTEARWQLLPTPVVKTNKNRFEMDIPGVIKIIRDLQTKSDIKLATIEYPPKVPGNGVLGTASLFKGFGELRGILMSHDIVIESPIPQLWKKVVLPGTNKDKEAAIAFTNRRLPGALPKAGPKSKKYHDGIADAFCLCWYGIKEFGFQHGVTL